MRLQAFPFERGFAKLEAFTLTVFGDDPAEPGLDKGFHGCVLLPRHVARFLEKAIRYLYGCLHMANHIMLYGRMSNAVPVRGSGLNTAT